MDRIRIRGGTPLSGEIVISGAKNATLPLMAAGLLTDQRLVLSNVPRLEDITTMSLLLAQHGIAVEPIGNDGRMLSLGGAITNTEAPYDIVRKMRASFLVLGPLLARAGEARVSLPGRLLHWRPADRPAPEGAGADGRGGRAARAAISTRAWRDGCAGRPSSSRSPRSAPRRTC